MKCALNLKEIMFRDVIETEIESSKLFILELKRVKSSASDKKVPPLKVSLKKSNNSLQLVPAKTDSSHPSQTKQRKK